jgi:hypothetical protein
MVIDAGQIYTYTQVMHLYFDKFSKHWNFLSIPSGHLNINSTGGVGCCLQLARLAHETNVFPLVHLGRGC